MSNRNANRLGTTNTPSTQEQKQNNPEMSGTQPPISGLNFTVPTEIVQLPSQGKYYPKGHVLHGVDEVEIKIMTANEENILANKSLIRKGIVIDRLIQSLLVDNRIDVNEMLLGDKNAIIVESRISGYGANYETDVVCPKCQAKYRNAFNLEEAKKINHGSFEDVGIQLTDDNTFLVPLLKMDGVVVECKMLTGRDESSMIYKQRMMKKKGLQNKPITEQLESFIVSVNGNTEPSVIRKVIQALPVMDSTLLRKTYKKVVPNIELTSEIECVECEHVEEVMVPFGAEFFWLK